MKQHQRIKASQMSGVEAEMAWVYKYGFSSPYIISSLQNLSNINTHLVFPHLVPILMALKRNVNL
jgi:hypothetical protein